MDKKLSQKEIDELLSKTPSKMSQREWVHKKFLEADKKFTKEIVEALIGHELGSREGEGINLMSDYIEKKISREECEKKIKELGYKVWWGGEASWSLTEVEDFNVDNIDSGYKIHAKCKMEYSSSHITYGEDTDIPIGFAGIEMELSSDFKVGKFLFKWQ